MDAPTLYAHRYARHGLRSAFFDTICCRHIGRENDAPNAYALNQTVQWAEAARAQEG